MINAEGREPRERPCRAVPRPSGEEAKAQPAASSEKFPQGSFPKKFAPFTGGRTVWQAVKGKARPLGGSKEGRFPSNGRPPGRDGPSHMLQDDEPDGRQAAPGDVGDAPAVPDEPCAVALLLTGDRAMEEMVVAPVPAFGERFGQRGDESRAILRREHRWHHGDLLSAPPPHACGGAFSNRLQSPQVAQAGHGLDPA